MTKRKRIQFPRIADGLDQNEAYFYLIDGDTKRKIRFHDYHTIYTIPGLYEQLFYERLKCCSHRKVTEILRTTVEQSHMDIAQLRVLDFAAGNGMVGEVLKDYGVSRIVGIDILPEAREACERDRPGVYDEYYVADVTKANKELKEEIASWSLDCLVTVAALGYSVPTKAFFTAFNLLNPNGWVAFNIKETFLHDSDRSGFAEAIRKLMFSDYLDLYHLERYTHRYSIEGEPLYYIALAGKKKDSVPPDFLQSDA